MLRSFTMLAPLAFAGLASACAPKAAHPRARIDLVDPATPPKTLSATGFFEDAATKTLEADVLAFDPTFKLWSDGAEKKRWIRLPEETAIDTSDVEHWRFPVGTQLFKEFVVDGKRIETRFTQRIKEGDGPDSIFMSSFAWRDDESDADLALDGVQGARGTDHDIPPAASCDSCHRGEPSRILAFSMVQLSALSPAEEPAWASFDRARLFDESPGEHPTYRTPGSGTEQLALGYLHANCGHCHNPNGLAYSFTQLILRLGLDESTPEATAIRKTTVNVHVQNPSPEVGAVRVLPGSPEESALFERFNRRDALGMPLLGSKHVDENASVVLADWIRGIQTN
jgi:hypothetical protein